MAFVLQNGNTTADGTLNSNIIVSDGDSIVGATDLSLEAAASIDLNPGTLVRIQSDLEIGSTPIKLSSGTSNLISSSQDLTIECDVTGGGNLVFEALGGSIPLNEPGDENLSVTNFTATSIVGALNELVGIASAGIGNLAQTLNAGNTTGSNNIIFSTGSNALWETDGNGSIGTDSGSRPASGYFTDTVGVGNTLMSSGTIEVSAGDLDINTGSNDLNFIANSVTIPLNDGANSSLNTTTQNIVGAINELDSAINTGEVLLAVVPGIDATIAGVTNLYIATDTTIVTKVIILCTSASDVNTEATAAIRIERGTFDADVFPAEEWTGLNEVNDYFTYLVAGSKPAILSTETLKLSIDIEAMGGTTPASQIISVYVFGFEV